MYVKIKCITILLWPFLKYILDMVVVNTVLIDDLIQGYFPNCVPLRATSQPQSLRTEV